MDILLKLCASHLSRIHLSTCIIKFYQVSFSNLLTFSHSVINYYFLPLVIVKGWSLIACDLS